MDKNRTNKRKSTRKIAKNRCADGIAAIFLLVLATILLYNLVAYLQSAMLDFSQVAYTTISQSVQGEIVTLRKEYVIEAAQPGVFTPTLAEGEKVKKNGCIGTLQQEGDQSLTPSTYQVYAKESGLLSYQLDGWENILLPESADQFDWLQTLELLRSQFGQAEETLSNGDDSAINSSDPQAKDDVPNLASGRPLAKVVDNLGNYTLFFYGENGVDLSDYPAQTKVDLCLNVIDESMSVNATVLEYGALSDGSDYLLLSVSATVQLLFEQRYGLAKIMGERIEGYAVPQEAVIEIDGKPYIYLRVKNNLVRKEAEIICENETMVMIKDITATDFVVTNPGKARDGQKIY